MEIEKKKKRQYFITGILIVLPILVTIYLFVSLFNFFDNILGRYISRLTLEAFGYKIPGLGILLFIVLIFGTGFIATNFLGRRLFLYFEYFWLKFPVIKKIYPAAKQVTHFLFSPKLRGQFQKVVLVEYPRKGIYAPGFVTNKTEDDIASKISNDEFFNVLIPTVPNPLTGFLLVVPKSELIFLDITIEEAIKLVVSGGVLNPKDVLNNKEHSVFEE